MKFYHTTKTSGGDYFTTELSGNEVTNLNVVKLAFICVVLAPLAAIVPALLVLLTLGDFEEEGFAPSILGALISIVFLLDVYYHFIIRVVLYILFGEEGIHVLFHLNIGYLAVNLFLILFGHLTYARTKSKMTMFYFCIGIATAAYFISESLIVLKTY